VAVALRSQIAPAHWLDDPAAMFTAIELFRESDAREKGRR